ncbi:hypothetical protein [Streptomyces platensis]|uniref:hypothetical protein n=1 Tax=Streptomyces platensis TaxID=58346 RepID=UPI00386A443C|nr:hypothetical protein OG962_09985 [Streptomyces platensis]
MTARPGGAPDRRRDGGGPVGREESEFGDPLQRIRAACVLPYAGVADVRRSVFRTVTDSADELRASWQRQAFRQAAALLV